MEIHAHVPKSGKTAMHWVLEGLLIVVSVLDAIALSEQELVELYKKELPQLRATAGER